MVWLCMTHLSGWWSSYSIHSHHSRGGRSRTITVKSQFNWHVLRSAPLCRPLERLWCKVMKNTHSTHLRSNLQTPTRNSAGISRAPHVATSEEIPKNSGGLAEMFGEARIICHYPTSHRLPVPVCTMRQSQRTGLQNTVLDPLLTRLQSRTFQIPESGQSKPTAL